MPTARAQIAQHRQALTPAQDEARWLAHGTPLGIDAYEAKAFYVTGALREMAESAALSLKRDYFLAGLFMGLAAAELIGRCVEGPRIRKPSERLRAGLHYVLPNSSLIDDYIRLRDFIGHGAAASGLPISFSEESTIDLMLGLSDTMDSMWTDPNAMAAFADAQIDPLMTRVFPGISEVIYVRDVKHHLDRGLRPSEGMRWDDWKQRRRFKAIMMDAASPSASGS